MALSADQAAIADDALARVRAAELAAREAVDGRSSFLTWLTGSSSSEAAGRESLRQTQGILAELERRRPTLEPGGLVPFVELAAAGASVGDVLEAARLASGAGFVDEVVAPTVHALDPTNLGGPVGKVAIAAAALVVLLLVAKVSR